MENLFKKGLASLALASVMTSSIFGGNAAHVDVRVKYLSGMGKAVLGHESWDTSASAYKPGAKKDLVELYIRVLDADGNLADKASDGSSLVAISVKKNGSEIDYLQTGTTNNLGATTGTTKPTNIISREATKNKNAARYTLDYTDVISSKLEESFVIKAGKKEKTVNIQFGLVDAKALIVRATRKSIIDPTFAPNNGKYMNDLFTNIKLTGDTGNLSVQSSNLEQITAGDSVPIRVYASTVASVSDTMGKFTIAPNLEGKKIVVVAVGDYSFNGNTNVYLGQKELTMTNGVAAGDILINYGLPSSSVGTTESTNNFGSGFGGLGVSFIAYALDTPSISNNGMIGLADGVLTTENNFIISGDDNDTDSIRVKSGAVVGFKGGTFDTAPSNNIASNLWKGNKTDVFVKNNGSDTDTIDITAVDKLGNPASVGSIDESSEDFTTYIDGASTDASFTAVGSISLAAATATAIASGTITVTDGDDNISLSKPITVKYVGGALAGTPSFTFQAHTIDLVGKTPKDIVGSLSKYITSVTVDNNSTTTKIYTEQKKEKEYVNMKLSIKVAKVTDTNVSLEMKVLKVQDGTFNSGIKFASNKQIGDSDKNLGAYKLEVQDGDTVSVTTMATLGKDDFDNDNIATITFGNVVNSSLQGTTTTLILKGSQKDDKAQVIHGKFVDAYVATTTSTKDAESFVNKDSSPGLLGETQIDFDFSGTLVNKFAHKSKAVAKITFSGQDTTNEQNYGRLKVGILGKPFVSTSTIEASANTNVVKAIIPIDGKLSVVLYGGYDHTGNINKDANKTRYNIESIQVNGFDVVATSRAKNGLTAATDIDFNQDHNVTVRAGGAITATAVLIHGISTTSVTKKSIESLPQAEGNKLLKLKDGVNFAATTSAVFTDSAIKIFTNQKYSLFDGDINLTAKDAYGNQVRMGSTKIVDNYVFTVSNEECAKVEMASGGKNTDPANIYFEECAAGKQIDLIISVNGNEKAKNTITFTNIVKTIENKKLNITLDTGTSYNVAHNDVIIKIQGDGQTARPDVTMVIKSDNTDATVKLMPVDLLTGQEFGTVGNKYEDNIKSSGSYYVVTSDKGGTITITADAIIPASESASGVDVPLTGTFSFKMADLDLVAPTASVALTAGGVVVTIVDKNLDTEKTKVEIFNSKGVKVTDSAMGASGVYTSKLPRGTYAIEVHAVDLAGNMANIPLSASIGVGGPTEEEEAAKTLTAKGKYTVAGTFSSYDFKDVDSSKDWIYTDKDGKVYQLLSIEATASDAFGFGEALTDETVKSTGKNEWYMVQTGEGKFDWALANKDGLAYKLSGVKADGTFKFTGRLSLNAVVSGKTVTFTAK